LKQYRLNAVKDPYHPYCPFTSQPETMAMSKPLSLFVLLLSLSASSFLCAAEEFAVVEKPGQHLDVNFNQKTLLRLMTANDLTDDKTAHNTYKVYAHVMDPLDPTNTRTLTKGPGDQFTHHRGIFIGWAKTTIEGMGTLDTWHMKNDVRQIYQKIVSQQTSSTEATLTVAIDWKQKDVLLLAEERTFVIQKPETNGALHIVQISKITAVAGATDLNGDPEHAGCHFRANEMVVKNKSATYLMPEGKNVKDLDLPWTAMTFSMDDRTYYVQHLSHPTLPKGNRYSAYRDYGRFGAFFNTKLAKGEQATFKLGFYISPGGFPDNAQTVLGDRYAQFAK
jgi:hypothetical protein